MRAWLYDTLVASETLQSDLGGGEGVGDRVVPRRSQDNVQIEKPYIIFGLGNSTSEQLADSTADDAEAERQFFQIWIHDEVGSYLKIDRMVEEVKRLLIGQSHVPSRLLTVIYLETSAEFGNETYGTIFRYIRFQAIIAKAGTPA